MHAEGARLMKTPVDAPRNSMSAMGRSSEILQQTKSLNRKMRHVTSHVPAAQARVKLQPWDGVDLVEAVLHEATGGVEAKPRETLLCSSPRVNQAVELKGDTEVANGKSQHFLLRMQQEFPTAEAPTLVAAHIAAQNTVAAAVQARKERTQQLQRDSAGGDQPDEDYCPLPHVSDQSLLPGAGGKGSRARTRLNAAVLLAESAVRAATPGATSVSGASNATTGTVRGSACFASPERFRVRGTHGPAIGQYIVRESLSTRRPLAAFIGKAPRSGEGHDADLLAYGRAERRRMKQQQELKAQTVPSIERSNEPPSPDTTVPGSPASAASPRNGFTVQHSADEVGGTTGSAQPHLAHAGRPPSAQRLEGTGTAGAAAAPSTPAAQPTPAATGIPKPCSMPFASKVPRFQSPIQTSGGIDVAPMYVVDPGARPSTAGRFSELPREPGPADRPVPLPSNVSFFPGPSTSARTTVNMQTMASRDSQKGHKLLQKSDPSPSRDLMLDRKDPRAMLSGAKRSPSPVSFTYMKPRPGVVPAPRYTVLDPHPFDPPKGLVEIERMHYGGDERAVFEAPQNERPVLNPNYAPTERRPPTPSIARPASTVPMQRRTPSPAAGLPPRPATSTSYRGGRRDASPERPAEVDNSVSIVAPVRRRPPSVEMRGTARDAPIMRAANGRTSPDVMYDLKVPETKTVTADIERNLSRAQREVRYHSSKPVDRVYQWEVPPITHAVDFSKGPGRKRPPIRK